MHKDDADEVAPSATIGNNAILDCQWRKRLYISAIKYHETSSKNRERWGSAKSGAIYPVSLQLLNTIFTLVFHKESRSMAPPIIVWDDQYVLNHYTKYIARDTFDARHDFGQYSPDEPAASICEAWRFPIVDSYRDESGDIQGNYEWNAVTFVFADRTAKIKSVELIGTCWRLYEPIRLQCVADSIYRAVTLRLPKRQSFRYKFLADGVLITDPLNPQMVTLQDGTTWSRVFTQMCTELVVLERWEAELLERLTDHILPFRTMEGQNFLSRYYANLSRQAKENDYAGAYRQDQPVGAVNFIDNLLAREEAHHRVDYKICFEIIRQILKQRHPRRDPRRLPVSVFEELYDQMGRSDETAIPGWDYGRYQRPRNFLELLRRHTYTGAFAHPKYGGNLDGAGWAYLSERFHLNNDSRAGTAFDWRRAMEPPLGNSKEYRG
jgi:hypothetical protein